MVHRKLKISNKPSKTTETDVFVKGADGKYVMNEEMVKDLLLRLKQHYDVSIKDIKSGTPLEKDYRALVNMVTIIYKYDASFHRIFMDHIKNIFSDIYSKIQVGTLGAYIAGCLISREVADKGNTNHLGCYPMCAGSIPPPADLDNHFCDRIVVQTILDGERFAFRRLYNPAKVHNAFVYVDYPEVKSFPGFSEEEKKDLSRFSIKDITLLSYDGNLIYKGPLSGVAGRLPTANFSLRSYSHNGFQKENDDRTLQLVMLVVLAIIVVWGCYRVNTKK